MFTARRVIGGTSGIVGLNLLRVRSARLLNATGLGRIPGRRPTRLCFHQPRQYACYKAAVKASLIDKQDQNGG